MSSSTTSSVQVVARFRPLSEREVALGSDRQCVAFLDDGKSVAVNDKAEFTFDGVFAPSSTQCDVFERVGRPVVDDVLLGFNGTVFAYGQTGSGKTWSMFGNNEAGAGHDESSSSDLLGIIPRAVDRLFDRLARKADCVEATVRVSFLEIYMERMRDLLNPAPELGTFQARVAAAADPSALLPLRIRERPRGGGVYVENLEERYVSDSDGVLELVRFGERHRSVSSTDMNEVSSRSHSVLTITVSQKLVDGSTCVGKLNFADLAGSERVSKTNASGHTLQEAQSINQSLSTLGNCINALTDTKRTHVPFRDSRLTFLLKDSLGGNTKTYLLVTCSPHDDNAEETLSTLQFAKRAKRIRSVVHANKQKSVEELNALVRKLTEQVRRQQHRITELEQSSGYTCIKCAGSGGASSDTTLPSTGRSSSSIVSSDRSSVSASCSLSDESDDDDLCTSFMRDTSSPRPSDCSFEELLSRNRALERDLAEMRATWETHVSLVMANKELLHGLAATPPLPGLSSSSSSKIVKPLQPRQDRAGDKSAGSDQERKDGSQQQERRKSVGTFGRLFGTAASADRELLRQLRDADRVDDLMDGPLMLQSGMFRSWKGRHAVLRGQQCQPTDDDGDGHADEEANGGRFKCWLDVYLSSADRKNGTHPKSSVLLDSTVQVDEIDVGGKLCIQITSSSGSRSRLVLQASSTRSSPNTPTLHERWITMLADACDGLPHRSNSCPTVVRKSTPTTTTSTAAATPSKPTSLTSVPWLAVFEQQQQHEQQREGAENRVFSSNSNAVPALPLDALADSSGSSSNGSGGKLPKPAVALNHKKHSKLVGGRRSLGRRVARKGTTGLKQPVRVFRSDDPSLDRPQM